MVEVKYSSQMGNHLFQYCFGRIIAEELGYKLKAGPIPGFSNTAKEVDGHDYSSYPTDLLLGHIEKKIKRQEIDLKALLADKRKRKIVINGFFQRYEYYKPYKSQIKNDWLRLDKPVEKHPDPDDILLYVRRGDYVKYGIALPFSYYADGLKKAKYNRVFLCSNDLKDPFISSFKRYKPIMHEMAEDPMDDFRFIMSFNKIIQSASTFSWWASFLSDATEIYTPIPLNSFWSDEFPEIDLRVDDEDRYIYIKCKSIHDQSRARYLFLKHKHLAKLWLCKNPLCAKILSFRDN